MPHISTAGDVGTSIQSRVRSISAPEKLAFLTARMPSALARFSRISPPGPMRKARAVGGSQSIATSDVMYVFVPLAQQRLQPVEGLAQPLGAGGEAQADETLALGPKARPGARPTFVSRTIRLQYSTESVIPSTAKNA